MAECQAAEEYSKYPGEIESFAQAKKQKTGKDHRVERAYG